MIRLSLLSSNFVRRSLFRLSSNCKRELLSIVREEVSDHHGAYGIDSIKMLKIKSTSITKEKIIVKAQIEQLLHL